MKRRKKKRERERERESEREREREREREKSPPRGKTNKVLNFVIFLRFVSGGRS